MVELWRSSRWWTTTFVVEGIQRASRRKRKRISGASVARTFSRFESGLLYYRRAKDADEAEEEPFTICVRTEEEKKRILEFSMQGLKVC